MNSSKTKNLTLQAASLLSIIAALLCSPTLHAQEIAGRVLIAIGDVKIERGAQTITAQRGSEVRSGDTLQLGAQSNAQVLFTDDSMVALRPETTFKVSEYSFKSAEPGGFQRAFFNLAKGGMRTVTGLIGKLTHDDDYRVTTPTSVIGIRGTNYALVQCEGNCRNADGTVAPNGTYGAVTDGRIAVTNQSGEHQFGANQYFQVASASAAPQRLIAPPGFLRDSLEGRARASKAQQTASSQDKPSSQSGSGSESSTTVAQTGQGATNGDSRVTSSAAGSTPPVVVTAVPFQTTNTVAVSGPTTLVQPTTSSPILFFRLTGGTTPVSACLSGPCGSVTINELVLGVSLVLQRAYVNVAFQDNSGGFFNVGTPPNSDGIPVTVSGGTISFSGSANRADYPTQQGAFRCSTCGPGNSVGFLDTLSVSGTISGSQASLTFSGSNAATGGGTFTVAVPQQTPPNQLAAAAIIPFYPGGGNGAVISTSAFWDVQVDAAGSLTRIGPPAGNRQAALGTAGNVVVGSDSGPGSLRWGYWTGSGAHVVDNNYASYTSSSGFNLPWIVGQATQTLPATLGTVTYSPIGSVVNSNISGSLNSATLTADFVNRNMTVGITASNTNGSVYSMSGNSGFSAVSGRFSAAFASGSCTGTCANPLGNSLGGSFGGMFAGPNAEAAGVAFTYGYGSSGGVSGAIAFKR
ncbi:MAG: FecR domain-containing protein [Sulfuritalea sp.]|jgi:hypothetical protein|nr:FecR domain-containing protein [Sulfuritalea sp.]